MFIFRTLVAFGIYLVIMWLWMICHFSAKMFYQAVWFVIKCDKAEKDINLFDYEYHLEKNLLCYTYSASEDGFTKLLQRLIKNCRLLFVVGMTLTPITYMRSQNVIFNGMKQDCEQFLM